MNRIACYILACIFAIGSLNAQSTKKIRELQVRRNELQKQIAASESLLQSTKKDVKGQLSNLALITGKIEERRRFIQNLEVDVRSLEYEISRLQQEEQKLEQELDSKKNRYVASIRYMHKNSSIQDRLMFVFSAETLGQTYRRLRYVREYANYQRLQAIEIDKKKQDIKEKQQELESAKKEKEAVLTQSNEEKVKLEAQEKERQMLVDNLKKKQRGLQNEINKNKKAAQQLNARIDKLIEEEIEKARKEAEAAKKKEQAQKVQARKEKKTSDNKSVSTPKNNSNSAVKTEAIDVFRKNDDDRQLAGSFERNKGILPMPITGPYVIVNHYGQYAVSGLKNVVLDNKGIDIRGKSGAQARAIFDGEVSAIFQHNGLSNVLVRHGSYISVYCNLSSVSIKKGSKVKTKTPLGTIHTDENGNAVLHFQLRRETTKLNPELWLKR